MNLYTTGITKKYISVLLPTGGVRLVSGNVSLAPKAQALMGDCPELKVARLDPEPQSHSLAVPSLETAGKCEEAHMIVSTEC